MRYQRRSVVTLVQFVAELNGLGSKRVLLILPMNPTQRGKVYSQ